MQPWRDDRHFPPNRSSCVSMAAPIGVKNGRLTVFHELSAGTAAPVSYSEVISGELRRSVLPHGVSLLKSAGVGEHDAFILVLDNDRASVACMLAAMELKCVCVLVSKRRIALLPHVRQQTGLTKVITVEGDSVTCDGSSHQAKWVVEDALRDGGVGMLTSGSVGEPKVVMCSWERMLLQGQSTHEQLFPDRPARIICGSSISHAYSINAVFTLLTSPHGEDSELCFASDTPALYELLSEKSDKFTLLYGTPATYTRLLELPAKRLHADVPYCAGTRLSRELFELTLAHNGLQVMQNYGSTETGDIAAWQLLGKVFADESKHMAIEERTYVGSLWPGVHVQVEADGEVLVWTPWQSMGYVIDGNLYLTYGAPHRTADRGVAVSADQGSTQLWLEGRIRPPVSVKLGMARPQTFKPEDIEQLTRTSNHVTDVLVLMQDQTARRTSMQIRVVLRAGSAITASELSQWTAEKLSLPVASVCIEIVDFLPCSPAGKLMYR